MRLLIYPGRQGFNLDEAKNKAISPNAFTRPQPLRHVHHCSVHASMLTQALFTTSTCYRDRARQKTAAHGPPPRFRMHRSGRKRTMARFPVRYYAMRVERAGSRGTGGQGSAGTGPCRNDMPHTDTGSARGKCQGGAGWARGAARRWVRGSCPGRIVHLRRSPAAPCSSPVASGRLRGGGSLPEWRRRYAAATQIHAPQPVSSVAGGHGGPPVTGVHRPAYAPVTLDIHGDRRALTAARLGLTRTGASRSASHHGGPVAAGKGLVTPGQIGSFRHRGNVDSYQGSRALFG